VNERAHQSNGMRLLIEGSVFGLILGAWLWGVVALGAHATAVQSSPPTSEEIAPMYEVSCQAPKTPADESLGCARKFRHIVGTSRKPGAGLTERSRGGES
jgi:hypothetical protein